LKTADYLNWLAGYYIALGVNAPDNYPETPTLYLKEKKEVMTEEELSEQIMLLNTMLGGDIIDNR
jgi:hypothetical protein